MKASQPLDLAKVYDSRISRASNIQRVCSATNPRPQWTSTITDADLDHARRWLLLDRPRGATAQAQQQRDEEGEAVKDALLVEKWEKTPRSLATTLRFFRENSRDELPVFEQAQQAQRGSQDAPRQTETPQQQQQQQHHVQAPAYSTPAPAPAEASIMFREDTAQQDARHNINHEYDGETQGQNQWPLDFSRLGITSPPQPPLPPRPASVRAPSPPCLQQDLQEKQQQQQQLLLHSTSRSANAREQARMELERKEHEAARVMSRYLAKKRREDRDQRKQESSGGLV